MAGISNHAARRDGGFRRRGMAVRWRILGARCNAFPGYSIAGEDRNHGTSSPADLPPQPLQYIRLLPLRRLAATTEPVVGRRFFAADRLGDLRGAVTAE